MAPIDVKGIRSFDSFAVTPTNQFPACWVLLHRVVRIVTVVDRDPGATIPIAPHIIDSLLDPDNVGEVGWHVLSRAEAARPLSSGSLVELAESEVEQVRYWNPATLGEVLFNHWD